MCSHVSFKPFGRAPRLSSASLRGLWPGTRLRSLWPTLSAAAMVMLAVSIESASGEEPCAEVRQDLLRSVLGIVHPITRKSGSAPPSATQPRLPPRAVVGRPRAVLDRLAELPFPVPPAAPLNPLPACGRRRQASVGKRPQASVGERPHATVGERPQASVGERHQACVRERPHANEGERPHARVGVQAQARGPNLYVGDRSFGLCFQMLRMISLQKQNAMGV